MTVFYDLNGIALADVPNAGVSTKDPNAKSGNPNHDVNSGKFGDGSQPKQKTDRPPNTSVEEYARMMDAVREAAREFDNPQEGDIREFLAGRAKAPDQVDVQNFIEMVNAQRLNDLVDMLDQQLRQSGPLARGRRKVRVSAPRGYVRKYLRSADSPLVQQLSMRLVAMGHNEGDVKSFFNQKVPNVKPNADQINASDVWDGAFVFPEMSESEDYGTVEFVEDLKAVDPVQMAERIAKNIPQPIINVTVEAPKAGRKVVRRNPETRLIESIEEDDGGES